jgi:uncharacterized protein with PIN domain
MESDRQMVETHSKENNIINDEIELFKKEDFAEVIYRCPKCNKELSI